MPKSRYRFNPDTLHYEKIELSIKERIIQALPRIFAVMIITTFIIFLLSDFIDTPQEMRLKRENEQLKIHYELLNKRMSQAENALNDIQRRDENIYRIIFESEPFAYDRAPGIGGIDKYKNIDLNLIAETSEKLDALSTRMVVQSKSYDEIIELARSKKRFFKSVPAISPISDRNLKHFASGFGYRIHPIYKTRKMHTGIDLSAPRGAAVYATGDGKVVKAGKSTGGYGNMIIIDHGFGYKSLYAHLHTVGVSKGQEIKRGEKIGTVGNTGRSIAPHLHYEVRFHDKPVDPVNYYFNDLTPEEYEQMINISLNSGQSFD
ncbi:MAG: peptidase M23 [Salinivirgaceae bacterium]|mgnify:CR=1 FL=1|nr:MAG: peptidase M23 [Salinivirgaceae bacterium]